MNACNLTSVLALEKGTVWLPKIRVINPLGSSFIISSSICKAQQRSFWTTVTQSPRSHAGMNTGNTKPHCDFMSSNSWRGARWAELYLIFHTERSKKHTSSCAALMGHLFKVVERKTNSKKDSPSLTSCNQVTFDFIVQLRADMEWRIKAGLQQEFGEKQILIWPFRKDPGRTPRRKILWLLRCFCNLKGRTAAHSPVLQLY